jgi:light-regulated signal transduction histidine kinase (bacteriophytochrome)
LQEPLRAIVGFTSILERRYGGKLDADADSLMERTVGAAKRMRALVNDLLTYSRVGRVWDGLQPTDFEVVVDQEIDNLRAAIDESSAVVRRGRLPTTMANPMLLGQVLGNLIGNAIKFRGDAAPRIHVSAERKNDEWEFSVRDNGIGLEPEYAERIFVIFQRLHSRTEYEGTGIGLAVCKKAVEQMGGRIWVESELGRGSTFFFTVPMKADEIPAVAHARPNDGAITLSGGDRL